MSDEGPYCRLNIVKATHVAAAVNVVSATDIFVSSEKYVRIDNLDHTKIRRDSAIHGYIGQLDNEIELIDSESLEPKIRMDDSVLLVGPGVTVLTPGNATDIAVLEILGDTTVGNIKPQVRRSVLPDSFESFGLPSGRFVSDLSFLKTRLNNSHLLNRVLRRSSKVFSIVLFENV